MKDAGVVGKGPAPEGKKADGKSLSGTTLGKIMGDHLSGS
jgi:hypothetical protein